MKCIEILVVIVLAMPVWSVLAQFEHQAYIKSVNPGGTEFGRGVAAEGGRVVVAELAVNGEGVGLVYRRVGADDWVIDDVVKAENGEAGDDFGAAVAMHGDTIVVGAPNEDSGATGVGGNMADNSATNAGAAYVFVYHPDGFWEQQAYLKPSNTDPGDLFGTSVSIHGDTIVVGAPGEDSNASGVGGNPSNDSMSLAGAAYVFTRSGEQWSQQAYLKASVPDAGDTFGNAVSVHTDWVIVGAPFERSSATGVNGNASDDSLTAAGAVYAFARQGVNWNAIGYLKASNTNSFDQFGAAVALTSYSPGFTELIAVIGAPGEASSATGVDGNQANNSVEEAGAVYLMLGNGVGGWGQFAYLKASNTGEGDQFGRAVAIDGSNVHRIVVGAPREDSLGSGVDGVQNDDSASRAGAVYSFIESNLEAVQEHYIKASNTDSMDIFGHSVAVDASLILVGAIGEDSSALGVNGDQNDDSATNSGAAYLLSLSDRLFGDRFESPTTLR